MILPSPAASNHQKGWGLEGITPSPPGFWVACSWVGCHSCSGFMVVSRGLSGRQHFTHPSPSSGLHSFCLLQCSWPLVLGEWIQVSHLGMSTLIFSPLTISALTTLHRKKQLLQPRSRAAKVCGYKHQYVECHLTTWLYWLYCWLLLYLTWYQFLPCCCGRIFQQTAA